MWRLSLSARSSLSFSLAQVRDSSAHCAARNCSVRPAGACCLCLDFVAYVWSDVQRRSTPSRLAW